MTSRRIFLVSPVFHGYWRSISAALESRGHEVVVHCYDEPRNFKERLENKLLHDLPETLRWSTAAAAMTRKAIQAMHLVRPDVVIVVKGDQLESEWWTEVARSGAAKVTWLYDELRRMRYTQELLKQIGPIASYSPLDTARLVDWGASAIHLPLAYDHRIVMVPEQQSVITFVGARYPSREKILQGLQNDGVPVRAYGRTWSRRLLDVIRTRQFRDSGIAAGPDLTRERAYGVMAGSAATLNLHGDQDGFTMRTFEAAGVGALQLVDRPEVAQFFDVGTETLAFSSKEELTELSERALLDISWAESIRVAGRRRALAEHTFDHRARVLEGIWA
jgi:spore maturation protein CgeB